MTRSVAVTLRPMTDAEYRAWLPRAAEFYAGEQAAARGVAPEPLLEQARAETVRLLPDGPATVGMHLLVVQDAAGRPVGSLWLGARHEVSESMFVWALAIDAEHRGRGLGRATMLAAEAYARSTGAGTLDLNVFGHNTAARGLYESLGYRPTSVQLRKRLT